MTARTLSAGPTTILYDDTLVSHADDALFTPSEHAVAAGGRGAAWVIRGGEEDWVLRHYRRGGLPARFLADTYIWNGLERTRPWREWRLLAELHSRGLPVPRPVAARVQRKGLGYRGDLITRRIPGARSLGELLATGHDAIPWKEVGACIRRLHEAGVWHADLNAHNVLLDQAGLVWIIDFDRGEWRTDYGHWRQSNMDRLQRSLRKLGTDPAVLRKAWAALLDGYAAQG